jgi:hypothetical protein
MRAAHRLLVIFSLFLGVSSAHGQTWQPRDVSGLIAAAHRALVSSIRDDLSGGVAVGDFQFAGDWSFGMAAVRAPEGTHGSPWLHLFLARYGERGWDVRYEFDAGFADWLTAAPDGLMPDAGRASLIDSAYASLNPERGDGSALLSLPYATGETQVLTGGPHGNAAGSPVWSALDFAAGSRQARAARDGTVWRSSSCPNFIRVDHADGWQTGYYHMPEESIPVANGQSVGRGDYVGDHGVGVGCGGSATGDHVHFSLRRSGAVQSIHNHDIGGWTVQQGGAEYQGCMIRVRDGYTRCVGQGILNEGAIGTGFPTAPSHTNILLNGDFSAGVASWWTWGGIVNPHVSGGVFRWTRAVGSSDWAVVGQTVDYSVPANARLELTLQLGNTSAVWKNVGVVIRDVGTWTNAILCEFPIPPNAPLQTYTVRGRSVNGFGRLQVEIGSNSPDGLPHHLLDNAALYYRPNQNQLLSQCIEPNNGVGRGLLVQFFNNPDFSALTVTRVQDRVNALWENGSPDAAVGADTFSARYTGWIQPRYTENYRFHTYADDGVRLWIDDQLVIDRWTVGPLTWDESPQIALTAGRLYPIRLDYFEDAGWAGVALQWSSPSEFRAAIPQSRLFPDTNMVANGTFGGGMTNWGTFADPPNGLVSEIDGGALRFYRRPGSASAVVLQNTGIALPALNAVEASFQLGSQGAARRRITVILHDADWSDLIVCSFWLAPNAPMATYRVHGAPRKDWTSAHISFYASTADDTGWYRVDNVHLNHKPSLNPAQTRCIDPAAPPAGSGMNSGSLIVNGTFANGMTGWGTFADPASAITSRVSGGAFEFYRTGGNSAVLLQNTGAAFASGLSVEAQFQLGNSSAVRKRITVILHDGTWGDLAVCSFWLEPNSALGNHVMRAFTTQPWTNAHIAFYASSADGAGWYRIDNVALIRRPAFALTGTDCYMPGSGVAEAAFTDMEIALPALLPTQSPYAPPGALPELPLMMSPADLPDADTTAEGSVRE